MMVPSQDDDVLQYPTLGPQIRRFIERHTTFGPGDCEDYPAHLSDEQIALLDHLYRQYPPDHQRAGTRVFRMGHIEVRKGLSKTEFGGQLAFAELHPWAPVRFGGYDEWGDLLPGRPVARPYIPMLATAEGQAQGLGFSVLHWLVTKSDTRWLFSVLVDRISRLDGDGIERGYAEAVSNAPSTRDGARTTFAHFDEPHWLVLPNQKKAVATMLLNLGKRRQGQAWALSTSTAGTPGMGGVEEDWWNEAKEIKAGRRSNSGVFWFSRCAAGGYDPTTKEGFIAALTEATGQQPDYAMDFETIWEIYSSMEDKQHGERVYLNSWHRSSSAAYDYLKACTLAVPGEELEEGALVALGMDCSRGGEYGDDLTALIATEVATGKQQVLGYWVPASYQGWEQNVIDTVAWAFEFFDVWKLYVDPVLWEAQVSSWIETYGDRVVAYWTNTRRTKMCSVARQYGHAISNADVSYVGPYQDKLLDHIGHAGRRYLNRIDEQGPLWLLEKLDGLAQHKFDICMAAVISWDCCLEARANGAKPSQRQGVFGNIRTGQMYPITRSQSRQPSPFRPPDDDQPMPPPSAPPPPPPAPSQTPRVIRRGVYA